MEIYMVCRDHTLKRQKEVVPGGTQPQRSPGEPPSDTGSGALGGSWLQEGVSREFAILWLSLSSLGLDKFSKEPSVSGPPLWLGNASRESHGEGALAGFMPLTPMNLI